MTSGAAVTATQTGTSRAPKRNFATRVFGYDFFISFALGSPPRGTHSYASDLARRLRERDFSVFFSEDEAAPGEQLNSTLLKALYGSRTLVLIANQGTLQEPRWVRQEVEAFRSRHPDRPIIPISVGGALQDATLAEQTRQWLAFDDKIWLDESHDAELKIKNTAASMQPTLRPVPVFFLRKIIGPRSGVSIGETYADCGCDALDNRSPLDGIGLIRIHPERRATWKLCVGARCPVPGPEVGFEEIVIDLLQARIWTL